MLMKNGLLVRKKTHAIDLTLDEEMTWSHNSKQYIVEKHRAFSQFLEENSILPPIFLDTMNRKNFVIGTLLTNLL